MRTIRFFILTLLILVAPAFAQTPDALPTIARKIADQITGDPKVQSDLYNAAFLKAVPPAQLTTLCKSLHQQAGPVTDIDPQAGNTPTEGKFTFHFTDKDIPVTLSIEAAPPHRVAGLWFGPFSPRVKSLNEIAAKMAKLPGQAGLCVQRLDDEKTLVQLNAEKPLAIGSTFKLYILATLVKDNVAWDKVVKLEDRYKSLPTGELQNWPTGAPVTVHTLAIKMISQSDNTATDHLLALAGPAKVSALQPEFGLKDAKPAAPFLSTLELFRLKSNPSFCKEFLAADAAVRVKLLADAATKPKPAAAQIDQTKPTAIDTVEWFASPADLCRLMAYFYKTNDKTALEILAINPGLSIPKDFTYAGYKGGSEPGVLNLTFILRTADHAYAHSATWNNPQAVLEETNFIGLIQSALPLIPKTNPK